MVSRKFDGAIIDCGGYNSLTNLAPSTANGQPVVHEQIQYIDLSMMPLVTWINGTSVQIGVGKAICHDINNTNSDRLWRRPFNIAPITASLPAGVSAGATVYLYISTNGLGDASLDSAFFSTANPPNNTPVGFNWVRHIASFVLNGSAQLNPFLMDQERWVTGNFASETFIAGASWASKIIPGCPLGSVEVFGLATPGIAVDGGQYTIRITTTNPTTAAIAAPSSVGFEQSTFDANLYTYFLNAASDYRGATDNIFGIAENRLFWHYKAGSTYLSSQYYPTIRLLKYRTVLKVLS